MTVKNIEIYLVYTMVGESLEDTDTHSQLRILVYKQHRFHRRDCHKRFLNSQLFDQKDVKWLRVL